MLLMKMTSITRYIVVASLALTVILLCSAILLFRTVKRKEFKQCIHSKAMLESDRNICPGCGREQAHLFSSDLVPGDSVVPDDNSDHDRAML